MVYRNTQCTHLITEHFKNYLKRLQGTLSVQTNLFIYLLPQDSLVLPRKHRQGRNWIYLERGECLVQLFHPKHAKLLKRENTPDQDSDLYKLPPTSQPHQPKYTEVILRQGQSIIIPHMWVYGFRSIRPSVIINCTSNDPFSFTFSRVQRFLKNKTST